MASEIIQFTPSPSANFQFQCTLDGAPYNVICTFNPYGQRYYITIYDLTGQKILSRPLIGSPSFANVSLTLGYFETTMIYRESSRVFEIPGIPPVPLKRPPPPAYVPPGPPPPPPPAPPDPYFSDVVLLLHGEGADGLSSIIDSSSHHVAMTNHGSVAIENSQEYFTGGAIHIPLGSWVYSLDSIYNFNNQSFTAEGWFYLPTLASADQGQALFGSGNPGSTINGQMVFFVLPDGTMEFYASEAFGNNPHTTATPAGTFQAGRWCFVSLSQVVIGGNAGDVSNQCYIHLDGVLVGSRVGAFVSAYPASVILGNYGSSSSSIPFQGYVQEYRVTMGVARYGSANYAVPAARFPDY